MPPPHHESCEASPGDCDGKCNDYASRSITIRAAAIEAAFGVAILGCERNYVAVAINHGPTLYVYRCKGGDCGNVVVAERALPPTINGELFCETCFRAKTQTFAKTL